MHYKIKFLFFILLVIFSLPAISQSADSSLHPKLDKYYPQKAITPPPPPAPATVPAPVAKVNPVQETKPVTASAPVVQPQAPAPVIPKVVEKPVVENQPTGISSTPLIDNQSLNTVSDSNNLNKPVTAVIVKPEPKKPKAQPVAKPTTIYMDTRLGSSSPLYNTYETNSDGAGTITNMPKR